jgi:hypothetical protein
MATTEIGTFEARLRSVPFPVSEDPRCGAYLRFPIESSWHRAGRVRALHDFLDKSSTVGSPKWLIGVGRFSHTRHGVTEGPQSTGETMSEMAARLYEPLSPHAEKIAGSADQQSVRYVPSTWHTWLALGDLSPVVTERVFSEIGPDTVSRSEIRSLAKDAASTDGRLALLIAVLVWGRGTANGRMRDAIIRTLTHPLRDQVLRQTAELAQRNAVAEAYAAWTLRGLQAAFFTKWLWAASSLRPEICCL